jgi:hypothetical protein
MPFPNLRVLQPNVQFFVDHSVKGIFEEGSYPPGGGGEFGALRSYLLARILWDPDCDFESALSEFLEGYYGNAAGNIRNYIERLHDNVEDIHVRIYDDPVKFLDPEFVEESISTFEEAEKGAGSDTIKKRIRLARMPLEYSRILLLDEENEQRKGKFLDFIDKCRSMGIAQIREGRTLEDSIREFMG